VFYPLQTWERWQVIASAGTLGAISLLAIALHRRAPWLLVGWLWYLGVLVPVIGLVQVGLQSMADRYSYFSAVGVFIMLVWSVPGRDAQRAPVAWVAVACVIVAALVMVAQVQASHWRDSRTLFTHALRVTANNYIAHQNLGHALEKEGRLDLAMEQYQRSVAIRPAYGKIHENIANVLIQRGQLAEAINMIDRAISLDPESQTAYNSKGVVLLAMGQPAAAEEALARSVQLDAENLEARGNYGLALLQNRKFAQAIEELTLVKTALPQRFGVRTNLARALAGHGRADLAMAELEEILRIKPDFAPAQALMRQIQGATTSPPASQHGG
jgi:Tfp pilus assembly protein PilF